MEASEYSQDRKIFNFKLIGIGLIFFIDFNVNTIDILPDIIGLVLIYAGIGKAAYINENLSKAKKYINYLFIFSLLKLIWNAVYLVFESFSFKTKILENNFLLLIASAFALIELIFCFFIFTNIIKGLEIFFQTGDGIAHEKKSGAILKFLNFFFALKFILAIFAQIPEMLTEFNLDSLSMIYDMYLDSTIIKNILVPPCFIVQTLTGLFVLSVVVPFFSGISKDKDLCEFIKSKINGALINDNFFVPNQNLNSAFMFFMAGCVFFVDLRIDNINFLPDFLICVFFLAGISSVLKSNQEIKNNRLNLYIIINLFISVFSYITVTANKMTAAVSFIGENTDFLRFTKISSEISFHISIIIFFLIFAEFYSFIRNLQRKHLEFSVRYLKKYLTSSEKNFDKNKNKFIIPAAGAFCVKTLAVVLPQSGAVMFCHSLILAVFAFFAIRGLYLTREAVYSYYN